MNKSVKNKPTKFMLSHLGWHVFCIDVYKRPDTFKTPHVYTWIMKNIKGKWSLTSGRVTHHFYIQDASDAVLLKLAMSKYFTKMRFTGDQTG